MWRGRGKIERNRGKDGLEVLKGGGVRGMEVDFSHFKI